MTSTKQNTPGLGIEYEVHLPAYFALLLNTNPEVEDFTLRSNVQEFGNLDDLLVDIKTKRGKNLYFAFQLKHKEKSSKNLLPTNFEAKGDFNLEKYCETFKKLNQENRKKYHFILYTNKNFDPHRTNEVKQFDMKHDECSFGRNFFDTSDGKHLYKFEVNDETADGKNVNKEDYREFFSRFSLYTGQTSTRDLDKFHILDILKYKECYVTYIDFFRRWHRGDFVDKIIDKKTLNVHLVNILLSPVAIKYHFSDGQDENLIFFETMVQQFDVTIIDASKQDFVKQLEKNILKYPEEFNKYPEKEIIKLGKKNKLIDRYTQQLEEETKLKLLHYFFQKPLILDFNESSEDVIYEASKLCRIQENGIKLVIVGRGINVGKFSHLKIFKNLTQVTGENLEETKRRCKLSLQGRNISFEEMFEDEIREFVTPIAFFQMLKGRFSIGVDKDTLPQYYIPRTVSTTVFDIESIIKHSSRSAAIMFYYEDKFEELKILIENIVDREDYFYEDFLDCIILRKKETSRKQFHQDNSRDTFSEIPAIILRKEECSRKQFDEICEELRKKDHSKNEVFEKTFRKKKYANELSDDICEESEKKILIQNIMNCEDHFYENVLDGTILRKKETSKKLLHQDTFPEMKRMKKEEHSKEEIFKETSRKEAYSSKKSEKKDDVYLFQVVDERRCLLLMSTKNTSFTKNYKSTKMSVEEKKIHVFFNKSINLLCAQPGMGKSTLMKYLKNECNSNFWTVMVDLKAHNQFLNVNRKIEEVLKHFLELEKCPNEFSERIRAAFLRKKKIALFLDGLDEIEHKCVARVLEISKLLGEMGFRIWLSSRQNLKQTIEEYFNIFTIEINEVNEDQQKNYIENRLESLYQKNEIEEIVKKIFNNTDLANNCQILEIPLQLHIITQIFLDDKSYYSNIKKNNFILTKMFEIFFEGKYKHYLAKIKVENPHLLGELEGRLENYEIIALHSVLDDEHFQKLQIKKPKLTHLKNWNFLGVITEVNSENKAVFEHLTFAEYFASKFLVKNFDKARILKEEIFTEKYQNLFLIFNIMLAEDSPLHLSIIYKDLSRIQEMEASSVVDEGGRNFLQVAACVATRHPPVSVYNRYLLKVCLVYDVPVQHLKGEDSTMRDIISFILSSAEPFKNDKIFEWNSLHYALAAGALYIVEAILEKTEKSSNFYKILGKYYSDKVVAYYSIRFGYHRLLSVILEKNSCHVTRIHSDFLRYTKGLYSNSSILHFIFFTSEYINRTRIVELLTGDDINKTVYDGDGLTFLHFAVFHEDIEFIKFLLEKKADPNVKDKDGRSPLSHAVEQNNLEISKFLVKEGANVNFENKEGQSPLFYAFKQNNPKFSKLPSEKGAYYYYVNIKNTIGKSSLLRTVERNKLEISKLLVENGADINIQDKDGWSLLCYAVNGDNFEISKLLVEKGADVNIKNKAGKSPVLYAFEGDNLEISKLLVEKGADVNIKNIIGKSPLFYAVERNSLEMSKLLIKRGADINIKNSIGKSPLFYAVERDNFEISNMLIKKGADVNIKNTIGKSSLFYAVERNNLEISKLLVEKGADVNIKNKEGKSPLFYAVKRDNLEISKLLIENGADVNIQDQDGCSPLLYAFEQNNFEISKLLIGKGADVNIKTKEGKSLLFYAVKSENLEISKILVEKGADVNIKDEDGLSPLLLAVERNNLEISKLMVEKGADVNIIDEYGESPLFYAVEGGNLEIVKLLVEKGADVNIKNTIGDSIIIYAVERNIFEITKLLVENLSDVNIQDKDGWSLLFYTVKGDNLEISKLLVEKGVDVNIKDKDGWSPLLLAVERNNFEISKLLIEKGADVNNKTKEGKSPLFYAVKGDNLEVSKLLVENGADVIIQDEDGWSPLMLLAVERNNNEILNLLVEYGSVLQKH